MEIYLVGGAVRDEMLGLAIKDRDYLVVGATPKALLDLGFTQVGRDFPVFLHPETKEEYALARTERKTGQGYQGFSCDFSPEVTLEADLIRRDLTINAMARDKNGALHDPYGGALDLERRVLRHVSPAFIEDPLRVLRLLRFWARFSDFTVAEETKALCRQMVAAGELSHLTKERVWLECEKALSYQGAARFFEGLADFGALGVVGIAVSQSALVQMNAQLVAAVGRTEDAAQRLAMFLWQSGAAAGVIKALPVPKRFVFWIELVEKHALTILNWEEASNEARFEAFRACGSLKGKGEILALARLLGREVRVFQSALERVLSVQTEDFVKKGMVGVALGAAIRAEQVKMLRD